MTKRDFHVHTTYSDGKNTPEEMIRAAVDLGMSAIGFSDHAPMAFETDWCMKRDRVKDYRAEIAALKEKYRGQIEVFCGIEQDYYALPPEAGYDFIIGSVHYVFSDGVYLPVDESAEKLQEAAKTHFSGDLYALIEAYYRTVADVVDKTGATVIGHFDLVSKFNEKHPLFDESDPRYIAAWKAAADKLIQTGVPFEYNVGAISRAWRSVAYPAPSIEAYLRERGAKLLYASDAHAASGLCILPSVRD